MYKRQQNILIQTPSATIAIRGTDFTVTVDELGRSLVILLPDDDGLPSGEIVVATAMGQVTLTSLTKLLQFQCTRLHQPNPLSLT